jgi:hypothetical protein
MLSFKTFLKININFINRNILKYCQKVTSKIAESETIFNKGFFNYFGLMEQED